jgi:hypothetical protein
VATTPATEEPSPDASAKGVLVWDNGKRCVTFPCPTWTVRMLDGKEVEVSSLELSGLGLSPEKLQALRGDLKKGYRVVGTVEPGEKGPAGQGLKLVVTEVLKAETP